MPERHPKRSELPIRTRTTYADHGTVDREQTVFCASRGGSVPVGACLDCTHGAGRTHGGKPSVVCLHPAARGPDKPPRPVRLPSPAELTLLSQIMTRDVVCVTPDLPVETLVALLIERNISAVPVVDAVGRPVGVVSKTDLVRYYHDEYDAGGTAADLMMAMAFTLTEESPIAHAAALMAVEGVHHLPVVDGNGKVVGIVSTLDVVRWLAHHDGFVVPPVQRQSSDE